MAPRSKGGGRPRADLTIKITLAGSPGVGKTSLTRRFVTNTFEERYLSTLGTKISSKEFAMDDPVRPGSSLTVSATIWDIMGNHQFRELLKDAFFMNAGGVLLVCDVNRPETLYDLSQWYEAVASVAGPNVPVVVLVNKSDQRGPKSIPSSEIELLCQGLRWPWFETSAKTGANVEAAFRRVAADHLRTLSPPKDVATPAA
jgi:small GTP-binding protein